VTLVALTPREASIFACVTDTVVAPASALPAVRDTDAVAAFDRWLARSPWPNRVALRGLLYLAELAPRALGFGTRLRRLDERARARLLARLEAARLAQMRQLTALVRSMAVLSYYGDDRVMLGLGYDAQANLDRGRALRAREGRP
jgi:hypothetical protein